MMLAIKIFKSKPNYVVGKKAGARDRRLSRKSTFTRATECMTYECVHTSVVH